MFVLYQVQEQILVVFFLVLTGIKTKGNSVAEMPETACLSFRIVFCYPSISPTLLENPSMASCLAGADNQIRAGYRH